MPTVSPQTMRQLKLVLEASDNAPSVYPIIWNGEAGDVPFTLHVVYDGQFLDVTEQAAHVMSKNTYSIGMGTIQISASDAGNRNVMLWYGYNKTAAEVKREIVEALSITLYETADAIKVKEI